MKEESRKIESIESVTVSSGVLAQILDVTDRRIRGLADEGILIRKANGRYLLAESIKNYIKTLKITESIKNSGNADDSIPKLEDEKAKHERIKRMQSELKLALMKGELHQSSDVEAVMTDMLAGFRSKLLNIPSKMAPLLVSREDLGYVRDTLTKEIHSVLEELKAYNPKDFVSDDYISFDEEMDYDGREEKEGQL